jgi:hypothetical protein
VAKILSRNKVKRNTSGLIPFVKGDPRINRNGRPKDFDQLRALAKEIASEKIKGTTLTRIEAMLLSMVSSRSANDRRLFLEYAFGRVKLPIEIGAMSDDDLRKFIAEQLALAGGSIAGSEQARDIDQAVGGESAG